MNWDQIEGKWHQFAGSARQRWEKLTDDDWSKIAGRRAQLVDYVQERYAIAKEAAEEQAEEWSHRFREAPKEASRW